MPDYNALVEGFQRGADFRDRHRANQQLEKHRRYALNAEGRSEFDANQNATEGADLWQQKTGETVPLYNPQDEDLGDPAGVKLWNFFAEKIKKSRKKKQQALDTGTIAPVGSISQSDQAMGPPAPAQETAMADTEDQTDPMYADGGEVDDSKKRKPGPMERALREMGTGLKDSTASMANDMGNGVAFLPGVEKDWLARKFNFDPRTGESGTSELDARTGEVATPPPNAGPPRSAIPMGPPAPTAQAAAPAAKSAPTPVRKAAVAATPMPDMVDFSQLDVSPHEVPDVKTDDWKQYRAQAIKSGIRRGLVMADAVSQSDDRITSMQQKGFLNYGKQGLALQQAGNLKGAMSAYRAAYQYFPNGHDVEFGLHNGKIVGVGKDEKTGKVVPGTAMVMDPERVSTLLENFTNPQAFRMWTKDWRDFQQGQREYQEVKKPLAQANVQNMANAGEADVLRAQADMMKAGREGGGGGSSAGQRYASSEGEKSLQMLEMQKPDDARYLRSVMDQLIQRAPPNTLPGPIIDVVMKAYQDGSLKQRLGQMGIQ